MNLPDFISKLKAVNTDSLIESAITETADQFVIQQKKQLFAGKSRTGEYLRNEDGEGYTELSYAREKESLNPIPGFGNPDLFLTGAFYEGIGIHVEVDSVFIGSDDSKAIDLERKYSSEIFGLGGEYKEVYITQSLGPVIRQKISIATGLKFF